MAGIGLSWSDLDDEACLRVDGAGPDAVVRVWPSAVGDGNGLPSMAGSVSRHGDSLCFVPRFGFVDGATYDVAVDGVRAGRLVRPARSATDAATEVVAIYPSSPVVPRNILRFYVWFSAPMSQGTTAEHIALLDAGGTELAGAIMESDYELWDPHRLRLTVLMDPARIKRGLVPHRELGYPLVVGETVRLVVDERLRDARGAPLRRGTHRSYQVGPDERELVDPARWRVGAPRAGTTDPLLVAFDRPLDRALLGRCLHPLDGNGQRVPGRTGIGEGEAAWRFDPTTVWSAGPHRLLVEPILEDRAGNSVQRVFDRDLDANACGPTGSTELAFEPLL